MCFANLEAAPVDEVQETGRHLRARCPFVVPPFVLDATKLHERRKR
jgi:hypothetical protein